MSPFRHRAIGSRKRSGNPHAETLHLAFSPSFAVEGHNGRMSADLEELRRLRRDGTWAASALPFQGASAYAHLHGDARGRKGVFLLYEDGWGFRPVAKPQLFVVDLGL